MSVQSVVSALSYFGLDEPDTAIYLSLLQTGPVTAGSISSRLGIDRGKTYRSISKLRNLGMVTTTFSNPITCTAMKPSDALITILQKKEDEIVTMEKLATEIIKDENKLIYTDAVSDTSSFSIIQGRENIYTRIGKAIQESTEVVYVVTALHDLIRMYYTAIPEKIESCMKNGGQVRVITEIEEEGSIPLITRLGITEVRLGKLPSKGRMIVEKGKQIIMSGAMRESADLKDDADSILHTNSPDMVDNIYSLCAHLWKISKPLEI